MRTARFAALFGGEGVALAAGALHDIGKCSREFAEYLNGCSAGQTGLRGPGHSTAGARIAATILHVPLNQPPNQTTPDPLPA
jgi:CRISPR-associated endonuclease/helicase Cas3